jgi:adenylate cyclase
MAEARVERRLAAILAADVAGYSRLMGADEEGTLATLKAHRRELIDPKIAEHRGRIVKTTGDGALVEFGSAVDAVRCAMEIQRAMAQRNATIPEDRRIEFRIGINVGDIIIDGGDIFGDGVNVAARLEGLAEPGGICVSGRVQEDAQGKLDVAFEDVGDQHLKNINRPIRTYRVRIHHALIPKEQADFRLLEKPSIAVLPFTVLQGAAEDESFSDGLTEDVITALSRVSSFFVIARNSTFIYKGKSTAVKQVARDLGVRYVLEGSVRHSGNRMRITAQLIDAIADHHVWAEKYDCDATDIFAIQDETAQRISAVVQAEIRDRDEEFLRPTYQLTPNGFRERRSRIERSRAIAGDDPKLDMAAAILEFHEFYLGYSADSGQLARGLVLAEKACFANPRDEYSHWILGVLAAFLGQHDRGIAALRRSVELNPNFALGYGSLATVLAWAGEAEESQRQNEIALRLSPRDPSNYFRHFGLSLAGYVASRYDEAVKWARMVTNERPDWLLGHVVLIASLAMDGHQDQAAVAFTSCRLAHPDIQVSKLAWLPFKRHADFERLKEGLRSAGVPE